MLIKVLFQSNVNLADGEGIGLVIGIRQVGQLAADREDRHHGDGQREDENLLLGHEKLLPFASISCPFRAGVRSSCPFRQAMRGYSACG